MFPSGDTEIIMEAPVAPEEARTAPVIVQKPLFAKDEQEEIELLKPYTSKLVWKNLLGFIALHLLALCGLARCAFFYTSVVTWFWSFLVGILSIEGVTVGAHRLYSHKAFKATWQLRLLVVTLHTIAGQNCMYIWVRDHRLHHKYSDTNADPHNASRGFWFSHVGWLCMKKHPLVIQKGKTIDMSDLEEDSIVMFQKKYYKPLYVLFALALPVWVPCALWNEYWLDSLLCAYFLRYLVTLNLTWTVNSVAHLWGTRPYDKAMLPRENIYVGFYGLGEGWHNYHHAFPWDYRAAELALHYSPTTRVIDFFHKHGWAYKLKFASDEMIRRRMLRTGDKTHPNGTHHIEEAEPDPEDSETSSIETSNTIEGNTSGQAQDSESTNQSVSLRQAENASSRRRA